MLSSSGYQMIKHGKDITVEKVSVIVGGRFEEAVLLAYKKMGQTDFWFMQNKLLLMRCNYTDA